MPPLLLAIFWKLFLAKLASALVFKADNAGSLVSMASRESLLLIFELTMDRVRNFPSILAILDNKIAPVQPVYEKYCARIDEFSFDLLVEWTKSLPSGNPFIDAMLLSSKCIDNLPFKDQVEGRLLEMRVKSGIPNDLSNQSARTWFFILHPSLLSYVPNWCLYITIDVLSNPVIAKRVDFAILMTSRCFAQVKDNPGLSAKNSIESNLRSPRKHSIKEKLLDILNQQLSQTDQTSLTRLILTLEEGKNSLEILNTRKAVTKIVCNNKKELDSIDSLDMLPLKPNPIKFLNQLLLKCNPSGVAAAVTVPKVLGMKDLTDRQYLIVIEAATHLIPMKRVLNHLTQKKGGEQGRQLSSISFGEIMLFLKRMLKYKVEIVKVLFEKIGLDFNYLLHHLEKEEWDVHGKRLIKYLPFHVRRSVFMKNQMLLVRKASEKDTFDRSLYYNQALFHPSDWQLNALKDKLMNILRENNDDDEKAFVLSNNSIRPRLWFGDRQAFEGIVNLLVYTRIRHGEFLFRMDDTYCQHVVNASLKRNIDMKTLNSTKKSNRSRKSPSTLKKMNPIIKKDFKDYFKVFPNEEIPLIANNGIISEHVYQAMKMQKAVLEKSLKQWAFRSYIKTRSMCSFLAGK